MDFTNNTFNFIPSWRTCSFRCYAKCSNYNCCNRCCGGSLYPCPIWTNCQGQEIYY